MKSGKLRLVLTLSVVVTALSLVFASAVAHADPSGQQGSAEPKPPFSFSSAGPLEKFFATLNLAFVYQPAPATGNSCVSAASGDWNVAATWTGCGGTFPTAGDSAYVQAGHVVTLTANQAINDLHISTGTTGSSAGGDGQVALGSNTLQVNGKLRCYFANVGTIPGTASSVLPTAPITITAGSSGKISFVGSSRTVAATGEWGATNTGSTTTYAIEINMNTGQTATMTIAPKASSWNIVSGTLDAQNAALSVDNGTAGQGDFTIGANGTLISNRTAASSHVLQRNASTPGGTLTVNGLLQLSGASPFIAMTTVNLNGTVEYSSNGAQTFLQTDPAHPGAAEMLNYANLKLSGTGAKTTVASKATSLMANGFLDMSGGATPPSFAVGSSGTFTVSSTGTTIKYTATGAQITDAEWDPNFQSMIVTNPAGATLGSSHTVNAASSIGAGGVFKTGSFTLTTPAAFTNSGTFTINGGAFKTSASFANSGTCNVSGTFQLNQGGTVSGNNLVYSSGTLVFN
jgi:fibronectin-binding autotransporter adhesin